MTTTALGASSTPLFEPVTVGDFQLGNRMVYAPLTRCRAVDNITQPAAVKYYSQRATKGSLMLTEATVVAPDGFGYPQTPGIFTQEQIDAWKPVVKAVHDKGATILCQIWHVGRVSHPEYIDGKDPVSPSAIAIPDQQVPTSKGKVPYPTPRELRADELPAYKDRFVQGAINSLQAGFDGVELHFANGYLFDSFLKESSNQRTDQYGGSIENRCRFPLEVLTAVTDAIGAKKVGVRLSPFYVMGAEDDHKYAVFTYFLEELASRVPDLAYVHMVEPRAEGGHMEGSPAAVYEYRRRGQTLDVFRNAWPGIFLVAGGHTRQSGIDALRSNHADLIVFGRLWLANPDFVTRMELDAPLNAYDRSSFYLDDQEKGYTDYPFLTDDQRQAAKDKQAHSGQGGNAAGSPKSEDPSHMGNAY